MTMCAKRKCHMKQIEPNELLNMGMVYQKRKEMTTVNLDAYMIKGLPYYLAVYQGKVFSSGDKGYAILSSDRGNEKDALASLQPHIYYGITSRTMQTLGKQRAAFDFSPKRSVQAYIKRIVEAGVLDEERQPIYERAYATIENMLDLQEDLIALVKEAEELYEEVKNRGYFTNKDVQQSIDFLPRLNLIQYKQYKDRYIHRLDFDGIYQNRKKPEIKQYAPLVSSVLLKRMTSKFAGPVMKESMEQLEEEKGFSQKTDDEMITIWTRNLQKNLHQHAERARAMVRNPYVDPQTISVHTPESTKGRLAILSHPLFIMLLILIGILVIGFVQN